MANVASLWYGSDIQRLGALTMLSYLKHGHSFTLYSYDKAINVPDGIVVKDANEILDRNFIFGKYGKWQPFADLFRYKMLMETDYIWVDMDAVCLKPNWDFGDYIFGIQDSDDSDTMANNAVLKLPKDSEVLKYIYDCSLNFDKNSMEWENKKYVPYALGPSLLTSGLKKFKLEHLVLPQHFFYPVNPKQFYMYGDPVYTSQVKEIVKNSYVAHVYDSVYNSEDFKHLDLFTEGSFLWYLEKEIMEIN